MAVPSSNIGISDIYKEANFGSSPSGDTPVSDLFLKSYFESTAFGGSLTYNAWGQYGNASGANRIYGLSASNTNLSFNDFANKVYFYDNSTYANYVDMLNQLPTPTPPAPPFDNDLTVFCTLWNSTKSYFYSQFQTNIFAGGSVSQIFSNTTEPILARAYWEVTVQPFSGSFGGASIDISINNTSKVSGGTINAGGITTFDWQTYGDEPQGSSSSGYIGTYFDINIS
jgi:hypothetical protein